jgi:effector-binding domain-containing protein
MDTAPEIIHLEPGPAISIRAQLTLAELPKFFGAAFGELATCGSSKIAGAPFAIYHSFGPETIDVEAVMPLRTAIAGSGRVQAITLPGGSAVQVRHIGPYQELGLAYMSLEQWLADHHRAKAAAVREVYLTEPSMAASEHVTLVVQPLSEAEDRPST